MKITRVLCLTLMSWLAYSGSASAQAIPLQMCTPGTVLSTTTAQQSHLFSRFQTGPGVLDAPFTQFDSSTQLANALMVDVPRNRLLNVVYEGTENVLWAYDAGNGGWYQAANFTSAGIPRGGMLADGSGYLVGSGASPQVLRVTPGAGFAYTVAPLGNLTYVGGMPTDPGSGDIAFDANGNGWMVAGADLWRVDMTTLQAVRQQRPLLNGRPINFILAGAAFGDDGTLYVSSRASSGSPGIYAVNLQTGAMTRRFAGGDSHDLASCAFPTLNSQISVAKTLLAESGTQAGIAEPGETLTYQIALRNSGNIAATLYAGEVTETVPAGSAAAAGDSFNCAADAIAGTTCGNTNDVTVPAASGGTPGEVLLTFRVNVARPIPAGIAAILNAVVVKGVDCEAAGNDCDETTPLGNVVVSKALTRINGDAVAPGTGARAGDRLTYTITLTNDGDAAVSNHAFYELLPAYTTFVSTTAASISNCAVGDAGQKPCTLTVANVPAKGAATVTFVVDVVDPVPASISQVVNLVTDGVCAANDPQCTPPPTCNPATQTCTPPPCSANDPHCVETPLAAVLTIDKRVLGVPQPVAGSADNFTVRYALTVANTGGGSARYDLVDAPQFDGDVRIVSATASRGQEAATSLAASGPWTLASNRELAAGATEIYTLDIRLQVAAGGNPDNDTCRAGTPGQGLFNLATLTVAGKPSQDDACVETPQPRTDAVLVIDKTGSTRQADIGDLVSYSLRIRNTGTAIAVLPVVVDRLPAGFRLADETVRVRGATQISLQGAPGPVLRITLDRIDPGAEVVVTYRVRLGVGAQQGDGINRAQVECRESVQSTTTKPCSNEGRWQVDVTAGVFSEEGCVAGQVYMDCNSNAMKDREELGIPGVRMYFENGTYLISDSEGKYSFCGLRPTTHVLKVDRTTLPTRSRLVTSSPRNAGDADSLFVDLKKGELHRADFIEGSCSNEVVEQVKARRAQGETAAAQTETGQPALKFQSKPIPQANPLQQGTDSANQPIEQTRHGADADHEERASEQATDPPAETAPPKTDAGSPAQER